jgi:hypothetical protein
MLSRQRLSSPDIAWCNAVDADFIPGQFNGQASDKTHHAGLRRRIVDVLVPPISHAHNRGKRDNASLAVLAHRRRGRTHNSEDAVEVNVEC